MKNVRLCLLFLLGAFAAGCVFSYVQGLEEGAHGEWWVLVIAAAAGLSCWLLGRLWDRRGKLPDEVLNRNNDRA